ncbi:hypothetical protein ACVBEE_14045 [Acinetobacter sp. ANC 3781]
MKKVLLAFAIAGLLTACNDDDDDDFIPPPTPTTQQGQLVDGPVSGVEYQTSSGIKAKTNAEGYFDYKAGDTIKFFIGGVQLGDSIPASSRVTPLQLSTVQNVRQNIIVFLQTLDTDANHDNGIQISDADFAALADNTINFNQTYEQFITDPVFTELNKTPIALETALTNSENAFYKDIAGSWELSHTGQDAVVIHISPSGQYILGDVDGTNLASSGVESGTLDWNPVTGQINPVIEIDTNGDLGLSNPNGGVPFTLNYDRTNVTLVESGVTNGENKLKRISTTANNLQDNWFNDTNAITFFSDGYYMYIDTLANDECDTPTPGVEYGKYTTTNGTVIATQIIVDTTGCSGLVNGTTLYPAFTYTIATGSLTLVSGDISYTFNKDFLATETTDTLVATE